MRAAKDTDFFIELPDVGTFRFGKKTYKDRAKIRSLFLHYARDLGDDDRQLSIYSSVMAIYEVLCVECPKGWEDIGELEIDDDVVDKQIIDLFNKLSEQEGQFRGEPRVGGETTG